MSFGFAPQAPLLQPIHLPLTLEQLESRRLLSVSPTDESSLDYEILFPDDPLAADVGNDEATEFWQLLSQEELLQLALENDPFAETADEGGDPLPAIPIDESFDPYTDCPGLDGEFCLPGDANQDGSVDFSDFLLLNYNFGSQGASWEDGDFDGDGVVAFQDFLILADSFGSYV